MHWSYISFVLIHEIPVCEWPPMLVGADLEMTLTLDDMMGSPMHVTGFVYGNDIVLKSDTTEESHMQISLWWGGECKNIRRQMNRKTDGQSEWQNPSNWEFQG